MRRLMTETRAESAESVTFSVRIQPLTRECRVQGQSEWTQSELSIDRRQ